MVDSWGVSNEAKDHGIIIRSAKLLDSVPQPLALSDTYTEAKKLPDKVISGTGTRCYILASAKLDNIKKILAQCDLEVKSGKPIVVQFGRGSVKKFASDIIAAPRSDKERALHKFWKSAKPVGKYVIQGFAELGPVGAGVGVAYGVVELTAKAAHKNVTDNKFWIRVFQLSNAYQFRDRDVLYFVVMGQPDRVVNGTN